jgi:hypothetical protein
MTYQSKKAGVWQTTLILPFYDIPITESRFPTNNYNITVLMTYQSKKAGIWQATLILPFYDIPIKENRYLANNSNITVL